MNTSPKKLWEATPVEKDNSNLRDYLTWLKTEKQLDFTTYHALWQWSVENVSAFWESLWHYFGIQSHSPYQFVRSDDAMPHTEWFKGATLNYAEHVFRNKTSESPALTFESERGEKRTLSWDGFEGKTAALQSFLEKQGLEKGDTVAAYIPNIPEASIGLMATISLGGIWSSCSPDFGLNSVLDRFRQIEPKILLAVDGYSYNNTPFDRTGIIEKLKQELPSVQKVIFIPYLDKEAKADHIEDGILWEEALKNKNTELRFTPVPFSHPIWVLYSSGTTGMPKAITHSQGGMLLEHLKYLVLQNDVKTGENFFWYTTTGWMMWNIVQGSLLAGATAVLYDGSPNYPNLKRMWQFAEEMQIHHFGTSAPFIMACKSRDIVPNENFDLSPLRSIGSTGSPLPPEGFEYAYHRIKNDLWLCSMSGGTDICTAWVGSNILAPVYKGEIQCRALGAALYAFDDEGKAVENEVGEMVITEPMPCMPIYFWGDVNYERYQSSYFEMYPGIWRHGDWIKITQNKGVIILGRSDATLNRHGIRIGTSEIYRALEPMEEIDDALIVNLERPGGKNLMPLFVVLNEAYVLTKALENKIKTTLKTTYTPRHVPEHIIEVDDLPYTINGKKMEAPVKKILMGKADISDTQKGAMKNPEALDFFYSYAEKIKELR